MPIPAGALTIVSFVIFYVNTNILSNTYIYILAFIVVLTVSIAMTSTIKYDNLPRPSKQSFKKRPIFFILVIIAIILSIISTGYAIFPIMMIYIIFIPIKNIIYKIMQYAKRN